MQKVLQLYGPRGEKLAPSRRYSRGGPDTMIEQARQNWDRKRIPLLDQDLHRNLSTFGRRTLLSLGRHIYWASGAVRGAVEDLCAYAAGSFMFESRSQDEAFRLGADSLIERSDRSCDVAGPPFGARHWRKIVTRSLYLDGDCGTVWVRGEDNEPYLQIIPSHRIASAEDMVTDGPNDGARIIDGVIVNDQNRALAYRVLIGDGARHDEFLDIPAASMALHFLPVFTGQVRGLAILGLQAWDMQDLDESKRWELLAQKGAAARVFQEFNEDGEAPVGSDFLVGPTTGTNTDGTPTGLWREVIDGGLNTYFKANSGSRIEAVKFDRPSRNQQDFVSQIWREALAGARLSVDFNLDLSKLSGGALRLLVEKINRNHEDLQLDALDPACRALDFFRLGTWIANGSLPAAPDWMKWEYQPAAKLTPDAKYDSQVTAENIRVGLTTRACGAAKFGETLHEVRSIREREADDLYARAERLHAKHPTFAIETILARLENDLSQTEQIIESVEGTGHTGAAPATAAGP